ncbi:MAG: hypothetical protein WKG07_30110 [Hymenobacter sp.]
MFRTIYHLVKERGYTIAGAREMLKQKGGQLKDKIDVIQSLEKVRGFLANLKRRLTRRRKASGSLPLPVNLMRLSAAFFLPARCPGAESRGYRANGFRPAGQSKAYPPTQVDQLRPSSAAAAWTEFTAAAAPALRVLFPAGRGWRRHSGLLGAAGRGQLSRRRSFGTCCKSLPTTLPTRTLSLARSIRWITTWCRPAPTCLPATAPAASGWWTCAATATRKARHQARRSH